jgi:hypothetical protein
MAFHSEAGWEGVDIQGVKASVPEPEAVLLRVRRGGSGMAFHSEAGWEGVDIQGVRRPSRNRRRFCYGWAGEVAERPSVPRRGGRVSTSKA